MKKLVFVLFFLAWGSTLTSEEKSFASGKEIIGPYCPWIGGSCVIPP